MQVNTGRISDSLDNIIQTKPLSRPNSTNNVYRTSKDKYTNADPYTSGRSTRPDDCINANLNLSPNLLVI